MPRLHYRKDDFLTWKRIKRGKGFTFINSDGKPVAKADRQRLNSYAIPPAWTDVAISCDSLSHIQVVGKDARGRKQYIYHPEIVKHNQKTKFDHMVSFGESLPTLRQVVRAHMQESGLTRNRIIATVIWLLEHTFIRVGNKVYADENQSYGLTTMRNKHVDVSGSTVTFSFMGKSGVYHELDITHKRVAKTIRACIDLPGYELFQYLTDNKERQVIDSADVNDYLQTYAGSDFSAKDFRTWGGSILAGEFLYDRGEADTEETLKRNVLDAISSVSKHLGNTKTICRTYYIHPAILKSYEKNILVPHFDHAYKRTANKKLGLNKVEFATWSLIKDS